jgi:hypothetical protein
MRRNVLIFFGVSALIVGVFACTSKEPPAPPAAPTGGTSEAAPDGSTLKVTAPTPQSPTNDVKPNVPEVTLQAGPSSALFAPSGPLQYRFQVFNTSNTLVQDSGLISQPAWTLTTELEENKRYTWRVRSEAQGKVGPWSSTVSFIGPETGLVNDPLTNGRTVGAQLGGHFIPGQGWSSDSQSDGIYYDIPTCSSCTVEFDITNIGKGEGSCCMADFKFMSMGDANAFGDFGLFRNHPWKMHLNQRGDGDGTGLEIIWRNGDAGDDNPGDHRIKMNGGGPDFAGTSVFHFIVKWTLDGYSISVGTNGGPQVPYLEDGWGGFPYEPPNHRIALGCYPRNESFIGAIYRNVKVKKNQ